MKLRILLLESIFLPLLTLDHESYRILVVICKGFLGVNPYILKLLDDFFHENLINLVFNLVEAFPY